MSTKPIHRVRTGVALAATVALVAWLWVRAENLDESEHDTLVTAAEDVLRHDLAIDQELLLIRLGVVRHYDGITGAKDRRQEARARLLGAPEWFVEDELREWDAANRELDLRIARRDEVLGSWIRSHPRLKNVASGIRDVVSDVLAADAGHEPAMRATARLAAAAFSYAQGFGAGGATASGAGQPAGALDELQAGIDAVSAARRDARDDLATDLGFLVGQARMLRRSIDEVDLHARELRTHSVGEAVRGLLRVGNEAWTSERAERETFQGVLYAVFLGLIGVGFWSMTRARTAALAAANQRLEACVLERTSELEKSNEELEDEVAERRRVEDELRRARDDAQEATRAKSRFLANMSHELRTPLNAVIGYSELLIEEAEEEGAEFMLGDLEKISAAGKHLLELINSVLDLSKIEVGKMDVFAEEFDVAALLSETESILQPLAAKKSNRLEVRCNDVGLMNSDVTKVRQIIYNLVSNAAKFTERGKIVVTADRLPRATGDRIRFCVADSGIGMSQEQVEKVFDAFSQADSSTTRNFGGTGLGLTICREFSFLLGGAIDVESEEGKGTTFMVVLPAVHDGSERRSRARSVLMPSPLLRPPERTVLIIDDDPAAREVISRTLEKEGWYTIEASGGEEGVRLAQTFQPAAVTVDVMMPGKDGFTVLAELQEHPATADIPVIMISITDGKSRAFSLGASAFLSKPIDRAGLTTVLTKCIDDAGARKVLVVDDDEAVRDTTRALLQSQGLDVVCAEDGVLGLEAVEREPPDLILLDLVMPNMDGFEFARRLRTDLKHREIPLVVLTSKSLTHEDHARLNGFVQAVCQRQDADDGELVRVLRSHLEDSAEA